MAQAHWLAWRGTFGAGAHPGIARLLCVGESTTAAGGRSSYPKQLENILNASGAPLHFEVVNVGLPGAVSATIVERLPRWIEKYRPDALVVMMGINDYDPYLDIETQPRPTSSWRLPRLLARARRLWASRRCGIGGRSGPRIESGMMPDLYSSNNDPGVLGRYRRCFEAYVGSHPRDPAGYRALADVMDLEGRPKSEEAFLRLALRADPRNAAATLDMAEVLMEEGRVGAARAWFERSLRMPAFYPPYTWMAARAIGARRYPRNAPFLLMRRDPASALYWGSKGLYWLTRGHKKKAETFLRRAEELRAGRMPASLRQNFARLRDLAHLYRVRLICVQYPLRPVVPLRELCGPRALLVDNESVFKNALLGRDPTDIFTDFFAGNFGHATAAGNKLLAQDVARTILFSFDPRLKKRSPP
jgi:tetratricopeptide (TPR) repeat protein